ncbi:MAG: bifunctional UDP-sugar hydrolase/5'-nucleotidase [Erysipelotrichaceae bacterium]|nr:bifunctional UDP-sugar hydrolase/5'-nucleotidase [Erysipelotrichaceae bacterium]
MKIRILASSDVHGYAMPYSYADNKPCNHGLLRLKSTIKAYRNENTLLIDNGDILQGSPLLTYYYEHQDEYENPMISCVNDIGYDYINIGNHDFNYGIKNLKNYLQNIKARCLTGNVFYKGECLGNEYVIHEFADGKRIALIGAVTHYISNWEKEENLKDVEVIEAFEFVKRTVEKIKREEETDGIVVVYHGGYERDLLTGSLTEADTGENEAYRMCKEIEGIDVLISGHQHRSFATFCLKVKTTQTACNGKELALIDYDLDKRAIEAALIPNDYPADKELEQKLSMIEEATQHWLDETCGEIVDYDLRIKDEFAARLKKHPLISFLNQIQKEAAHSDLSGNALFNDAVGFNQNISMRDIVSTYVYPNTIVVLRISGKILKEYLEKCAEYFAVEDQKIVVNKSYIYPKPQHFNYDMVDGVDYVIKVSNPPGERIISLKYQRSDVKDDDSFLLAINNYRASGGGNFLMFKDCEVVREIQDDMVNVIGNYLLKHPKVKVEHHDNIEVII